MQLTELGVIAEWAPEGKSTEEAPGSEARGQLPSAQQNRRNTRHGLCSALTSVWRETDVFLKQHPFDGGGLPGSAAE